MQKASNFLSRNKKRLLRRLHLEQCRPEPGLRQDVQFIPVQPFVKLEVYWKVLGIGRGPALILHVLGVEIVKYDCFGREDGHYHVYGTRGRLSFPESGDARDQVAQSGRLMIDHTPAYLIGQPSPVLRRMRISNRRLKKAIVKAQREMYRFLDTVAEIQGV